MSQFAASDGRVLTVSVAPPSCRSSRAVASGEAVEEVAGRGRVALARPRQGDALGGQAAE